MHNNEKWIKLAGTVRYEIFTVCTIIILEPGGSGSHSDPCEGIYTFDRYFLCVPVPLVYRHIPRFDTGVRCGGFDCRYRKNSVNNRYHRSKWFWMAIGAAISILCGITVITNPFISTTTVLWLFAGVSLVVDAVFDMIGSISVNREKAARTQKEA